MKLTKENVGQKFKKQHWDCKQFFTLLAIATDGVYFGENEHGFGESYYEVVQDWLPYEEPKKNKWLLAPAIEVEMYRCPVLNNNLFEKKEQVEERLKVPVNWPARIVIKNTNIDNFNQTITGDLFFYVEK